MFILRVDGFLRFFCCSEVLNCSSRLDFHSSNYVFLTQTSNFKTVVIKYNTMPSSGSTSIRSVIIPRLCLGLLFVYFYCEYLIYYVTQVQCDWPELKHPIHGEEPVRAMMLADTHLLGSRKGHWLDKWRREWQMHRAFQSAITVHLPEVVFVLGDLFDEGEWCSENEFKDYVKRFSTYFNVPENIKMYVLAGNHDVGFHYRITPRLVQRFEKKLNSTPVSLVSIRNNHFVLVNSVAMEGDGCKLCKRATQELEKLADTFDCSNSSHPCKKGRKLRKYTRPIILQHYPLYRPSDEDCSGDGLAPYPARTTLFKERWDCLSKESTEFLIEKLLPRAAFGGHTHHGCVMQHIHVDHKANDIIFPEYSLASFSWRNRLDPKYYLVMISNDEVVMSHCDMPTESAMKTTAVVMLVLLGVYLWYTVRRFVAANQRILLDKEV